MVHLNLTQTVSIVKMEKILVLTSGDTPIGKSRFRQVLAGTGYDVVCMDIEAYHGQRPDYSQFWFDECQHLEAEAIRQFETIPALTGTEHKYWKFPSLENAVKLYSNKRKPKPYYRKGERW